METAFFRETGKQLLLSEQNLLDCGWYKNNKACFGGYQVRPLHAPDHHPPSSVFTLVQCFSDLTGRWWIMKDGSQHC